MAKQVDVVRGAVGDADVRVRPVLCFVGADWSMFAKPFTIEGVVVTSAKPLLEGIERADDRGVVVSDIAERIAAALPAAS